MKKPLLFIVSLALVMVSNNALAKDTKEVCMDLRGDIVTEWDFENCDSPVGMCTKGKITRSRFRGTTRYVVDNVGGSAAEDPNILTYVGTLYVTTHKGTLTIKDIGTFDQNTGNVSSQSREISGTGKYEGVYGSFFTTGLGSAPGFDSNLGGFICKQVNAKKWKKRRRRH